MDTVQGIVYAILHGFTEILPIAGDAHRLLVPLAIDWPKLEGPFLGLLFFSSFLALFFYYIHDCASIISSLIKTAIFFKRPKTIDEYLPFFILITSLPLVFTWLYLGDVLVNLEASIVWVISGLVIFSFVLAFSETRNRKNKNMFSWSWLDALFVGFFQLTLFFPGIGRQAGAFSGTFFRNFGPEAAIKYVFLTLIPIFGARAYYYLEPIGFWGPIENTSLLTIIISSIVCFFSTLLAIGGVSKSLQRKGVGSYIGYRLVLALALGGLFWFRNT